MLIKVYTKIPPLANCAQNSAAVPLSWQELHENQLHIIENVTDVVVYNGNYEGRACSPVIWGPQPTKEVQLMLDYDCVDMSVVRVIDFTKEGKRCRLVVTNVTYVCNDEGKTIERVAIPS